MPTELRGPLSGFRDMLAEQMFPRQRMIDTIKHVYESYGFLPLDTPAIERYETLRGKYGAEGEKLMYRLKDHGGRELALRYDLTVPLSRVVFQHKDRISFPYKRYQIGNAWRGDSPQSGRYREFMQFDADIVGTSSPIADTEIVEVIVDSMKALNVDAIVRVNNRRILDALAERLGITKVEEVKTLISAIDKSEKIGKENVLQEIKDNFGEKSAKVVESYLTVSGDDLQKLKKIQEILGNSEASRKGVENLQQVFSILRSSGYGSDKAIFDQTIARGLDYYTDIIYETTLTGIPEIGSVCSGGRYDKLIAKQSSGKIDLPAVGTSMGVDRLFAGLEKLGKIESVKTSSQVMVANFNNEDAGPYMELASTLRRSGISTEVYFDSVKLAKQMKFADSLGIKYVVFLGSEERKKGAVKVKDLKTGEQSDISIEKLVELIKVQ